MVARDHPDDERDEAHLMEPTMRAGEVGIGAGDEPWRRRIGSSSGLAFGHGCEQSKGAGGIATMH